MLSSRRQFLSGTVLGLAAAGGTVFAAMAAGPGEAGSDQGAQDVTDAARAAARDASVSPEAFLAPGESLAVDARPAIERALASGRPVRFRAGIHRVGWAAGPWCLKIPSNAVLLFDDGAIIMARDGLPGWKRVVTIENASNVRVFGELRVDGNVRNVAHSNNEHMHGIFLFDTTDSHFERIRSENCRGDNIFIGGTDDTRGSRNNHIGSLHLRTAGRKCFVGHAWDGNQIGAIEADNSAGGWSAGRLAGGGGCIHIEPDAFSGRTANRNRIGTIASRGIGDSFTAGTTAAQASAYVCDIGDYRLEVIAAGDVTPWVQYGVTLNIARLRIAGARRQLSFLYAARLNAEDVDIGVSVAAPALLMSPATSRSAPELRFRRLRLANRAAGGGGIENDGGILEIGEYIADTAAVALWNRGLHDAQAQASRTRIGAFRARNIGRPDMENYAILHSQHGAQRPSLRIDVVDYADTRPSRLANLVRLASGAAGFSVGEIVRCETSGPPVSRQ